MQFYMIFSLILLIGSLHASQNISNSVPNSIPNEKVLLKYRAEELGDVLRKRLLALRHSRGDPRLDLIFLVDASSSVGPENFESELRFVRKLLADLEVSSSATRVSLVTFASSAVRHVDTIDDESTSPRHKCDILERALPAVNYTGGATYTLGAILEAQKILRKARHNSKRIVFLLTDGYSNGGDPRPAARALKEAFGVTMFTFGVRSGNTRELAEMASRPSREHAFLLPSFEEFTALVRRALHQDLRSGAKLELQPMSACDAALCTSLGENCGCAEVAHCVCDTLTGRSQCVCPAGHQGSGLPGDCRMCPSGTYAPVQNTIYGNGSKGFNFSTRCLPCPDPGHESPPGATSVHQCKCREGFTASSSNPQSCKVLECPPLQPPARGSFVGGPCSRVFNAACGVTCGTGHRLVGSSIRLCRANGTWSGQPARCTRRECPPLTPPRNGWVKCGGKHAIRNEKKLYSVDAICEVGCDPGHALLGSSLRTCLALGAWDGLPTTCKAVTCPPVPLTKRVTTSEACKTRVKQFPGQECRFECKDPGFALRGSVSRKCGDNGRWSGSKARCVDIQPPEVKCPADTTIFTLQDESEAEPNIIWPDILDNSDQAVRLRISPPVILIGGHIGIGRHKVTIRATDPSGNFATCRFYVTVKDTQPPHVQSCESPPIFLTAIDKADNVTWTEPIFTDNSGKEPKVNGSHQQGSTFPLGVTQVRYEARDPSGNVAPCSLNITVQSLECESPLNGQCQETSNGSCSLVCDEGYSFALLPEPDTTCDPSQHDTPFLDCSEIILPDSFSQPVEADLPNDAPPENCNQLVNTIEEQLMTAINEVCTVEDCELLRLLDPCLELNETEKYSEVDEESNLLSRYKRSKASRSMVHPEYKIESQNKTHTVKFRLVGKLRSADKGSKSNLRSSLGTVRAILTAVNSAGVAKNTSQKLPALRVRLDAPDIACPAGSVLRTNDVCVQCPRGTYLPPGARECLLCQVGSFQQRPGQQSCTSCPEGSSTRPSVLNTKRQHCRPLCRPGTKSRDGVSACSPCPHGTFQILAGQRNCTACPGNTTTLRRGSNSLILCRELCPENSISKTGLAPCTKCPAGYAQAERGKKECEPLLSLCAAANTCPPSLHASHPCMLNPCKANAMCLSLPSEPHLFQCQCPPNRTGTFCEDEIENACSSSPCDNGGTCVIGSEPSLDSCDYNPNTTPCTAGLCDNAPSCKCRTDDEAASPGCNNPNFTCTCTSGFLGPLCEEDINECDDRPCGEYGLCTDYPGNFSCECASGYGGEFCERMESACAALEPCVAGVCVDEGIGMFRCECPITRTGIRCDEMRDPCDVKQCQNGATCIPEPWPEIENFYILPEVTCACPSGYSGTQCELLEWSNQQSCLKKPCSNGGTCKKMPDDSLKYECVCPSGFAGDTCHIVLPEDAVLRFPGGGTLGYVLRENAVPRPLKELTLCSWLRTADTINYGTPVSYATPQQDNTLALTDYSGFVVYVNGERVVTDVAVNDGAWHLVCLLWASRPRGAWRLYKDGALSDQGEGLANNTQIPGGGTLVLGQEQDSPGGSFSSTQSFLGRLGPTALWPILLSPSRLRAMFERCDTEDAKSGSPSNSFHGNKSSSLTSDAVALWSWKDALAGIRGKLQLESSAFCAGCSPPVTPPNGMVNVSGDGAEAIALFSCLAGYRPVGARRAKCGKRGSWQFDIPLSPSCQRLSCGKPVPPDNAEFEGSDYEFGSRLYVICLPGYVSPPNSIECLASGSWSPLPPACVEARCPLGSLSEVARGKWNHISGSDEELDESYKRSEARVGEQVELVCEEGLVAHGKSLLTCVEGGNWDESSNLTLCIVPECALPPPRVPFARIPLVSRGKARYTCNPGFAPQGSPLVTCIDGWHPLPVCVHLSSIKRCSEPPHVKQATYTVSGNTAHYACNKGYNLEGEATIKCSAGTWQNAPVCKIVHCFSVPELSHGTVTISNGLATLECDKAFALVGASQLQCVSGAWTGEAKCELVGCLPPRQVDHGTVTVTRGADTMLKGAIAEYKCSEGHQLVGPRSRKCLGPEKQWSSIEPYCKLIAT